MIFPDGAAITDTLLDGNSNNVANGNATLLQPVPLGKPQIVNPLTIVSEPLLEQVGSSGRNHLRLAGILGWDITVDKSFNVTERTHLQLGWQSYNVMNDTNLGGYQNNIASRFFNTYTLTSTVNRQFQLFGKFSF